MSVLMHETDRKNSHIQICLEEDVDLSRKKLNGFESFHFDHDALPELAKDEIDLSVTVLGKKLKAPIIVGAMTGGSERASELNRRLALAAEACGVGFALGSQRKLIEDQSTFFSFDVRSAAPNIPLLFGNIGAVQLNYGVGIDQIQRLIDLVGCDAFNFHLNPLQEAIQPEGQTNFSGLTGKIQAIASQISTPILLKEVGSGLSFVTLKKIQKLAIAGVETGGRGGTSWSKVESFRTSDSIKKNAGELFADWGISTAESIQMCRAQLPGKTVIGSGGIRNGIEVAKALILGSDAVAIALPFLKAAEKSVEDAILELKRVIEELRIAMFVTGSRDIFQLKERRLRC